MARCNPPHVTHKMKFCVFQVLCLHSFFSVKITIIGLVNIDRGVCLQIYLKVFPGGTYLNLLEFVGPILTIQA